MRPVRRQRGEEAAAAVEFAILAPLVFALVFGMLTGALAWNSKQQLSHAAREGARFGATLPGPDTNPWPDWLSDVLETTRAAGNGELDVASAYLCVAYVQPAAGNQRRTDGTKPANLTLPGDNTCFDDDRPTDEPRVQVLVSRQTPLIAVLVNITDLTLYSTATSRHEPTSVGS